MSDTRKENLFAKLAAQKAKAEHENPATTEESPSEEASPPPALPEPPKTKPVGRKNPVSIKGKRDNPDYCQANAYVPKSVRRSVDKALLDIEGLDYSTLVTDLLRKWLKSRGISE